MDLSGFGSPSLLSKSRLTPSRKQSAGTSSKRQSLKSTSRSTTSAQIIYRSTLNIIETYGLSLPVLVREALTFSEKSSAASVQVSSEGWAWFVCGRRLLVWQCESSTRRPLVNQCRELTLPSSDLAYRAELVTIFNSHGSQMPSCLAASPEGIVRYWPSIAHETSSVEVNADLQGQECDSLTNIQPIGCILATTTASIVLLTPHVTGGRPVINIHPLRPPQGWLGGITKLIPSIIFGSLQASHGMETKLVKVAGTKKGSSWVLHVLAGHTLQQWLLASGEIERLMYECDISKLAIDAFQKTIWEPSGGNPNDIQVWLLDLQPTEGGVCVLLGATNPQISPQFFYALGTLLPNATQQPVKFDRFCPAKPNTTYRESEENELLSCRVVLHGSSALLYTRKKLQSVSAVNFQEDAESLEFLGPTDEILGASLCKGIPVLFTKEHGLVAVIRVGATRADIMAVSDAATMDSSVISPSTEPVALAMTVTDSELEDMESSGDSIQLIEAAFLHFIRGNIDSAERLVGSMFPEEEDAGDGSLDQAVVGASMNMVDAMPAGDPRWANQRTGPTLGSTSMQIASQLEDKLRIADAFVSFLKWAKIWDRLRHIHGENGVNFTRQILAEHRERLVLLSALRELQNTNASLLDQCMHHIVGSSLPPELSVQDVFYREATGAHRFIHAIVEWTEVVANGDRRPQEVASSIFTANNVVLKSIDAVLEWRKQNLFKFCLTGEVQEYLPWTSTSGKNGLRDALFQQHSMTLKFGARATGDLSLRTKLYDQLLRLADTILDGWRAHVVSVRTLPKYDSLSQQYENTRLNLIQPFLTDKEVERAAVLGEKYLDFNVLVQVCEMTDNVERLDKYCEKFSEQNFVDYLFNWYIREGKPGRLLEKFRSRAKPSQQKLSQFLVAHPSLSWLQDILSSDFVHASSTLETMGLAEKELLHRKKTLLSLSKLSLLASSEPDDIAEDKVNELDVELGLISHQEDLPQSVLTSHCYDLDKFRVLSPSEIIQLYISDQNLEASETDFKAALDVLNYVSDDLERSELRHSIWCNAILRDSWNDINADSPVENLMNLLFFKLVDLLECMGCNLEEFLPPVEVILESEELGDLRNDRRFQYLIRLGYEHFQKGAD